MISQRLQQRGLQQRGLQQRGLQQRGLQRDLVSRPKYQPFAGESTRRTQKSTPVLAREQRRSHLGKRLTLICLLFGSVHAAEAQRFGSAPVSAELNTSEIFDGQSARVTVRVQGLGEAAPKAVALEDFEIESVGKRGSQTLIVNGRKWTAIEYQFVLTPTRTGRLTVPPFVVEHDGKTYTSKTLTLNVKTADEQDTIRLSQTATRQTLYPAQTVEVSLVVQVKSLDNAPQRNPLEVNAMMRRVRPPHLTIPWLSDDDLPAGLVPQREWESILVPLGNDQQVGFRINNIPAQRSLFLDLVDRAYLPTPERVTGMTAEGQSTMYWQFDFRRRLNATLPGTYTLAPCVAKGEFAKTLRSNPGLHSVFAKSNALEITVLPVPEDGRPENYLNVSGSITEFASEVTPRKANVGDPLTLTIRLRGSGTIDEATPPELNEVPLMSGNFRILEPTSEMINGDRVFTYSIRPLSSQIKEVPAIEASYFDAIKEKYVPISTVPVPLEVGESKRLNANQIVAAPPDPTIGTENDIELSESGLFGNATDIESFRNDRIEPVRWFVGWGGTLGAYALAWGLMTRRKHVESDPLRASRRNAPASAKAHLATAKDALAQNDIHRATNAIRSAFVGLIEDVTGQPTAGMTPRELRVELSELKLSEKLGIQAGELLEECDAGRYGASRIGDREVDSACRLLDSMLAELEQRGLLS